MFYPIRLRKAGVEFMLANADTRLICVYFVFLSTLTWEAASEGAL